jgi:uncharacterized membrane-anchored protein
MRSHLLTLLAAALISIGVAAEDQYNAHRGPYDQAIAGVAHLKVADGYLTLDPADTQRLMEKMQNPGFTNSWYFSPQGSNKWFAIFDYDDTGHVKDDEKVDADAVLESLKQGAEETNKERAQRGWAPLRLVGWRVPPHYESDTKRLSWATLAESEGHQVINYTTKILGRTGVMTVTLATDPDQLDSAVADLKSQLADFSFDSGNDYTSFRNGDKVAEYGLAGLIVGGAAAVAAKSGLFKWIGSALIAGWKLVVAAVVGIGAAIKNLFTRKKN